MHIAVIGAGLSGLTCARQLQAQGNTVVVYEQGREPGGRISTRYNELGGFDYGAQYFSASGAKFKQAIAAWREAGWIAPWQSKLATLQQGAARPTAVGERLVAVPGMATLMQRLAHGLELRTEHLVKRIDASGRQWLLAVQSDTVPIDATAGPFDAVVVAVPADQAAPLLGVAPQLAEQAGKTHLVPCWALILGFQESLGLGYDGAWVQGSRLAWIANDASKPQRRPGEHWVGHASIAWSIEHLEDDNERAKDKLLKAFHEATGSHVQPIYAAAHRWRYAQSIRPLPDDCLWDAALRIGVCGDWFAAGLEGNGRIENAYLSGLALADSIRS